MQDNVILFVLGNMFLVHRHDGTTSWEELPEEKTFSYEGSSVSFSGFHTNEAPIKHLISRYHDDGNPVTDIIYLCSDSCLKETIPGHLAASALDYPDNYESPVSSETFLNRRIELFCEENGYDLPMPTPIAYDPLRPADSLSEIVRIFNKGAQISIDITGGQRDAVILLAITAQIIKMGSKGTTTGEIVYSNLNERKVYRQNNTFDLIDLINAINSFTEYGRADQLNDFFGDKKKWTTDFTKQLVVRMKTFADSLALCQVRDIDSEVHAIHEGINEVEKELGKNLHIYDLFSSAISQIDEPNWLHELGFEDSLKKLCELDERVTPELAEQDALQSKLRKWQWDYVIERNELLFYSLIPTIREKFIPEIENQGILIVETIRWCVKHKMMQQALCIYRERISRCLLDLGYFQTTKAFGELEEDAQIKEVADLCFNCSIDQSGVWVHQNVEPGDSYNIRQSKYKSRNNYLEVVPERERQLRLIIAWYKYLHVTRNTIMHIDSDQGNYAYFFALAFLGKDRDCVPTLDALTGDMLEALSAIDDPEEVSDSEWNDARSVAGRDLKRFRQRVSDGATRLDKSSYKTKSENLRSNVASSLDAETQSKLAALKASLEK